MKKILKLSSNLRRIHLQRYRKLHSLESGFPLRVSWVDGLEKDSSRYRRPYVFMKRHSNGILRNIFMFPRSWIKASKPGPDSILRWEDDGGLAIDNGFIHSSQSYVFDLKR